MFQSAFRMRRARHEFLEAKRSATLIQVRVWKSVSVSIHLPGATADTDTAPVNAATDADTYADFDVILPSLL